MQRAQQSQRVHVAVLRAEACTGDFRPDLRQHLLDLTMIEHFILKRFHAGLVVHALECVGAIFQFAIREQEMEPPGLAQADVKSGLLVERACELRPELRGLHGPAAIFGHAGAFALHPYQGKVSTRGAKIEIAAIEHHDLAAAAGEAPGDRHADETASHYGEVRFSARRIGHFARIAGMRRAMPTLAPVRRMVPARTGTLIFWKLPSAILQRLLASERVYGTPPGCPTFADAEIREDFSRKLGHSVLTPDHVGDGSVPPGANHVRHSMEVRACTGRRAAPVMQDCLA